MLGVCGSMGAIREHDKTLIITVDETLMDAVGSRSAITPFNVAWDPYGPGHQRAFLSWDTGLSACLGTRRRLCGDPEHTRCEWRRGSQQERWRHVVVVAQSAVVR